MLMPDTRRLDPVAPPSRDERRLRQLDLLQRLVEAVNRAERMETLYAEAIDGLLSVLGTDRASILALGGDGTMHYAAWKNLSADYRQAMERRSPWHRGETDPNTIIIADARTSEVAAAHRAELEAEGIRALIIVPLTDAGELLGRMVLYYDHPYDPEPEDVRLAESIARHVGLAITRWRSRDELTRREAAFTALAEQAADIIARLDRDLRHVYVNPAVETAIGVPRERLLGRTLRELGMPVELVDLWEAGLRRVLETGMGDVIGFEFDTPGGIRYFESVLVPERDGAGQVVSVLVTTRDLTDRKVAEDRLRFLTEAGTLLSSSLDLRTTLDAVVRIAAESLGDGCAIDVLRDDGRIERIAIHVRDPFVEALFEEMERSYPSTITGTAGNVVALRTGEPQLYSRITEGLILAASKDESHAALWRELGLTSAMCVPLLARERRLGVLTVVSTDPARIFDRSDLDVTIELALRAAIAVDHAMLFEETRRARDEAQRANAAKANFLAVMSHELRTPLAAILGYAELVADEIVGPVNPTQRDQLERIKSSGTHLLMLIEEILSFARIDTGHEMLRLDEVDLCELVSESAAVVQPLVQKKRLELRVNASDPVIVTTDAGKVRQILLNLLGNAVKFTEMGSIVLQVIREQDSAVLIVQDTGVGIPAEHLEHVFDTFWQVEHATTRRKGGTGLGLSVARRLARLLGGDILVESRLGMGSRFSVVLPAEPPPS